MLSFDKDQIAFTKLLQMIWIENDLISSDVTNRLFFETMK